MVKPAIDGPDASVGWMEPSGTALSPTGHGDVLDADFQDVVPDPALTDVVEHDHRIAGSNLHGHEPLAPSYPVVLTDPHVATGVNLVRDKTTITVKGVRYVPLSKAVWQAYTDQSTLRSWMNKRIKFGRRTIQTYTSPISGLLYISEESVQTVAQRFVKWPSNEPAGPITLGETDDQSGFIPLPDAARIVGVSRQAMWLWADQAHAPAMRRPLDVIKCPISDHLYVRQKDASELKKLLSQVSDAKRRPGASLSPHP